MQTRGTPQRIFVLQRRGDFAPTTMQATASGYGADAGSPRQRPDENRPLRHPIPRSASIRSVPRTSTCAEPTAVELAALLLNLRCVANLKLVNSKRSRKSCLSSLDAKGSKVLENAF